MFEAGTVLKGVNTGREYIYCNKTSAGKHILFGVTEARFMFFRTLRHVVRATATADKAAQIAALLAG